MSRSDLTVDQMREKLIEWVKARNAKVEYRKFDWQELWVEVEPYFIRADGDDQLRLRLMREAFNYR